MDLDTFREELLLLPSDDLKVRLENFCDDLNYKFDNIALCKMYISLSSATFDLPFVVSFSSGRLVVVKKEDLENEISFTND